MCSYVVVFSPILGTYGRRLPRPDFAHSRMAFQPQPLSDGIASIFFGDDVGERLLCRVLRVDAVAPSPISSILLLFGKRLFFHALIERRPFREIGDGRKKADAAWPYITSLVIRGWPWAAAHWAIAFIITCSAGSRPEAQCLAHKPCTYYAPRYTGSRYTWQECVFCNRTCATTLPF